MDSVIVLASGGLNSTVAAARARTDKAVHFLYADEGGAAAERECASVEAIAEALRVNQLMIRELPCWHRIPMSADTTVRGLPTETRMPLGGGWARLAGLLWAAVEWAGRIDARAVITGVSEIHDPTREDTASGGSGCRELLHAFNIMLETLNPERAAVQVAAPLVGMAKGDIVQLGLRFDAPLGLTWSCHAGEARPCGYCPGCLARKQAFAAAEQEDASPARV
jgi:7-cyano-7-deazaguanine synthase